MTAWRSIFGLALVLAMGAVAAKAGDPAPQLMINAGHAKSVDAVEIAADGKLLFTTEGPRLRIWDLATRRILLERDFPAAIQVLRAVEAHGTLYLATPQELYCLSLETFETVFKTSASGLSSIIYEPEMDAIYALQMGNPVQIDPAQKKVVWYVSPNETIPAAEGASAPGKFGDAARLIPFDFERTIIADGNRLWRFNTDFLEIEAIAAELGTGFQVHELDEDRLFAIRTMALSSNSHYELIVLAKEDFSVLGKQSWSPEEEGRIKDLKATPRFAFERDRSELILFNDDACFVFSIEGNEPRLDSRTPIEIPTPVPTAGKVPTALSAVIPLRTSGETAGPLLIAGNRHQSGVPGAKYDAFLRTLHRGGSTQRLESFGEQPFKPSQIVTHPTANEVYLRSERGEIKRLRLIGGSLVPSTLVTQSTDLTVDPNGRFLVWNGALGTMRQPIDPLRSEWPSAERARHFPIGSDATFSRDGTLCATNTWGQVKVVEVATGRTVHDHNYGKFSYASERGTIALSPDNRIAVFFALPARPLRADEGIRRIFCVEIESGEVLWSKEVYGPTYGIRFLNTSTLTWFAESHGRLDVIDATTGSQLHSAHLEEKPFNGRSGEKRYFASALSRDAGLLALAAKNHLTLFDPATAKEIARLPDLESNILSAAFFANPKFLLLGTEDNKLRLWNLDTMRELAQIALFSIDDEWILTTPDLRFQSSEGGAKRMHFVQDRHAIPLESLFEQYHTPRLFGRLIAGEELSPLVPPNALRLPPEVEIVLTDAAGQPLAGPPADGSIRVRVSARSERAPVTEIRLYHNGKLVSTTQRGLVVEDDEPVAETDVHRLSRTYALGLLDGVNEFRAIALNAQRTESVPAVKLLGAGGSGSGGGLNLHLVVVGINAYANPRHALNYAVDDARAFAARFEDRAKPIFGRVETTLLLDADASRAGILGALEDIAEIAGPRDVLVFYYAGHGVMSAAAEPEFYLVPPKITQLYGNDRVLAEGAISATELRELAARIPAQKQLFILDACQSAGALEAVAMRGAAEERAIAQLARSSGTYWLTATGSEQFAAEFKTLGHGVFTYSLLEALDGKGDNGDGQLTVRELDAFLQSRVPELTREHRGTPQYPASYGFGQDFPLSLLSQ